MSIYSNGYVYGISIELNNNIIFEKKYNEKINNDEIDEIKEYYNKLTNEEKNNIITRVYTLCLSTQSKENIPYMCWYVYNKELFENLLKGII
jgi:hypothetical protein